MRGIQGALIVASTLQIVVGFSGLWRNVARFVVSLLYFYQAFQGVQFAKPQLVSFCEDLALKILYNLNSL